MSTAEAAIQKKIYGSGITILMISNEEMEYLMRIVKSLEESILLIKELLEQLKMKQKKKKEDFFQCYQEH